MVALYCIPWSDHRLCIIIFIIIIIITIIVTQPLFESRMNWIHDPTPPTPRRATMDYSDTSVQSSDTPVQSHDTRVKSRDAHVKTRDPPVLTSDTQASAIAISASSGAPLALPHPKKSRRRRRRRNRRSANENSVPCSAAPVTPDERWANRNSASQRATQHQPAAIKPNLMMSTPVYKSLSFHSSHLISHSLPFQQPIEIQHSSLAWTTVNFQGFISQPFQTPARIRQLTLID